MLTNVLAAVSNTILSRREPMLITTSGQRRKASDLLELNDSESDSEDSDDSSEPDSDSGEEGDVGDDQHIDLEKPASGEPATVAAEEAWQGPAFDNVLAFWQVL